MNKKILIIILLGCLLFGCKKEDKQKTPPVLSSIAMVGDGLTGTTTNFKLDDGQVKLIYSDGSEKLISIDKSMMSEEDFFSLFIPDTYIINLNYNGFQTNGIFNVTKENESERVLADVILYNYVSKVDDKYEATFATYGKESYSSFQIRLKYNKINVTDIKVIPSDDLSGSLVYDITDDYITINYTQSVNQTEKQDLFTIQYNALSDERIFLYDDEYTNIFNYIKAINVNEVAKTVLYYR